MITKRLLKYTAFLILLMEFTTKEARDILGIDLLYKRVNHLDAVRLTREQRRAKLREELFYKDLVRGNELGLNKFKDGNLPQRQRTAQAPKRKISVILQSTRKATSKSV